MADKIFLAAGIDLRGTVNRHRYQLSIGRHSNLELQKDWNALGPDNFSVEILEQLEPRTDTKFNARKELEVMERMWLDRLKPFGNRGYNQKTLSRGEKLERIRASQRVYPD